MKNIIRMMVVLAVSCGLAGCFQVDQVVTLSPDGSGTLEETFLISRKVSESMAALTGGMAEQMGGEGVEKAPKKEQSFFKDDEIKKRSESFGTDVRFVKMERISNKQFEGYKALYSFKNINTLRLDQGPSGMKGQQAGEGDAQAAKGTAFIFTPGKTATLVVKQPKKTAAAPADGAPAEAPAARESSPEELAMVRQMFDGMRISTKLVLKGKVTESNATWRSDSIITLAEIDFGKLLDKPEILAKMATVQSGDQEAAMEMIKKLPGMKVDMNDEVRVSFR
jgi:hypothetical protein